MAHFKKRTQPHRRQNTTYKPPFLRNRKVSKNTNPRTYVFYCNVPLNAFVVWGVFFLLLIRKEIIRALENFLRALNSACILKISEKLT